MARHMASGGDKWLQIARQMASGGTYLQAVRFYLHNLVFQQIYLLGPPTMQFLIMYSTIKNCTVERARNRARQCRCILHLASCE